MGEKEKEDKKKKKSTVGSVMGVPIENIKSISGVPIKHEEEEEEEKEEEEE